MFGLTIEKLLLVGLIAAVIIGPRRLPGVVARLAAGVAGLRRTVDVARHRAATELGVPADAAEWRALDPRRYDPRRIIAEALAEPPVSASAALPAAQKRPVGEDTTAGPAPSGPGSVAMRRVRVGSSAHPRWIEVPVEATTEDAEPDAGAAPTDDSTAGVATTA